jgi:hypothetical protein
MLDSPLEVREKIRQCLASQACPGLWCRANVLAQFSNHMGRSEAGGGAMWKKGNGVNDL